VLVLLTVIGFNSFQKQVLKERVETRRRELIAQGEKLTLAELAPKRSSADDAMNAGAELLNAYMQLSDSGSYIEVPYTNGMPRQVLWRGDLTVNCFNRTNNQTVTASLWTWMEAHLPKDQEHLDRIIQVTGRPDYSFDLAYEKGLNMNDPSVFHLINSAQWLQQAMFYQLHRDDSAEAIRLLRAQIRLLRLSPDGDTFILHVGRHAVSAIANQSTWQALQYPGWNDMQLGDIQANWEALDFLPALEHALAEHRARNLELIAALRRDFAPYGKECFTFRNPPAGNNLFISILSDPHAWLGYYTDRYLQYSGWKGRQSFVDELYVMNTIQVTLDNVRSLRSGRQGYAATMQDLQSALPKTSLHEHPYTNLFTRIARPASTILSEMLSSETRRQMTIAAIAIKRYQLAHGRLPDSLAELVPAFLSKPILDPMDGKPLRYHPNLDGTFLLYSVGFDGQDNGGTNVSWDSLEEGTDLVWPIPARP
jgi:hypothetical protein